MGRTTQIVTVIATAGICLGAGFFSGREYMRYEVRTAFMDGMKGFGRALSAASPIPPAAATPATSSPPAALPPAPAASPLLGVIMTDKGWRPKDIHHGEFQEYVTFDLEIKNLAGRDVRAFDGSLHITDLLDNEIMNLHLAVNDSVPVTKPLLWSGTIDYNEFIDRHRALRNAEFKNIKTSFRLNKVVYADGTTQSFH